ncbi:MAG TPA: HAD hydrolase-like protein [Polyangia bacterium]|nr:HAD hydrolase-like protein [Polyangia bacterium]
MPPRFSLVLFDLDGTLVDTAEDIAAALNAALDDRGFPTLPTESVVGYIGNGATRLVQRALPPAADAAPADEADLVRRFKAHYAANVCVRSRIYPGIAEMLARLPPAVSLAVLTNKPGDLARPLLEALGIAGRFQHIIGEGDGFARKPAPDAAQWLMRQHGVAPDAALLVGDGLPDVQVARAAGCPVAAATWGYTTRAALSAEQPTFIVDTPAAVAQLILTDGLSS